MRAQVEKERDSYGREVDRLRGDWVTMRTRAETAENKVAAGLELASRLDQFADTALMVPDSQLYRSLADSLRDALAPPAARPTAPTGSDRVPQRVV